MYSRRSVNTARPVLPTPVLQWTRIGGLRFCPVGISVIVCSRTELISSKKPIDRQTFTYGKNVYSTNKN